MERRGIALMRRGVRNAFPRGRQRKAIVQVRSWRRSHGVGRRIFRRRAGVWFPSLRWIHARGWMLRAGNLGEPPAPLKAVLSPHRRPVEPTEKAVDGWWIADPCVFPIFLCRKRSWEREQEAWARRVRHLAERHPVGAMLLLVQHEAGVGMVLVVPQEAEGGELRLVQRIRPTLPRDQVRAWVSLLQSGAAEGQSALLAGARWVCERSEVAGRFFRDLRPWMERLSDGWRGLPPEAREERRKLSLTFLTRVIFLFFVQEKGWLASDPLYLERLSRRSGRNGSLYRDHLRPLFTELLNTPREQRSEAACLLPNSGEIPYLNGGLFAESEEEAAHPHLDLCSTLVREIFSALHVRYRFHLEESKEGQDEVLDPRLLGTVFERWMDVDARARAGAFYTPPTLVHEVVEDSLVGLLQARGLADVWRRFNEGASSSQDRALLLEEMGRWRILDPACGSGAFLLGVWSWMLDAKERLVSADADVGEAERASWSRQIAREQLYGVDRSPVAVQLAELRLWLAVASTEPREGGVPRPLPGLRHRVRCGDALLSPSSLWMGPGVQVTPAERRRLAAATRGWLSAHGRGRTRAMRRWGRLERRVLLGLGERRLRAMEVSDGGGQGALEGVDKHEGPVVGRRAAVEELRAWIASLQRGDVGPFFDAEVHFPEVFAEGGFDAVVGNPPWFPMHRLEPMTREAVRRRFLWLRAHRGGTRVRQGDADIAVAFAEQGWRWLRTGGVLGFVVPAKVFRAPYGRRLRQTLYTEGRLVRLRDLAREEGERKDFAATCYPGVMVVARLKPGLEDSVRVGPGHDVRHLPCHQVLSGSEGPSAPWSWSSQRGVEVGVTRELDWRGPTLAAWHRVRMGVKTGANAIFLQRSPPVEGPWLPAMRGRDLHDPTGQRWLLFGHDLRTGEPLSSLPSETEAWLSTFHVKLRRRVDARPGAPLWKLQRVRPELLGHRVAWADISRTLAPRVLAPLTQGGPVCLNTLYYLPAPDRRRALRWAAWLGSGPLERWLSARAPQAHNGYRRHFSYVVETVPWPSCLNDCVPQGAHLVALDRLAERLLDTGESGLQAEVDARVSSVLEQDPSTRESGVRRQPLLLGLASNNQEREV